MFPLIFMLPLGEWDPAQAATLDFSDYTFGSQPSSYLQGMVGLKTMKWAAILAAAEVRLNHSGKNVSAVYGGVSSEGEMFDLRAKVDESDDEEACMVLVSPPFHLN
jgi:hypothetical protein